MSFIRSLLHDGRSLSYDIKTVNKKTKQELNTEEEETEEREPTNKYNAN